jgi:hypothetical protein
MHRVPEETEGTRFERPQTKEEVTGDDVMQEKRAHPRLETEEFVMVTVESASSNPELEGESFHCLMKDLSAGGLQFTIFVEPPVGAVLHLYIAFQKPVRAFRHIGRVVWTKSNMEDETYAVGVEFTDTPRDVFTAWKNLMDHMIGHEGSGGVSGSRPG